MLKFNEWLEYRENVIKVHVPVKTQELTSSCGAGALWSVLNYFGIKKSEKEIRRVAKTNENGTRTQDLIKAANHFGLKTKAKYNMDAGDLKKWLDEGKPVIVCIQAWGTRKYYKTKESGHYAVAIGYDDDNVYFQDSYIKGKTRGHIPWKDFIKRWRDKDEKGASRDRYGIAMWKDGVKTKEKVEKSKKIK